MSSSWRRDDHSLALDVTVPVNTRAEVRVPKLGWVDVTLAESGQTVWQEGASVRGVPGIAAGRESAGHVTLEVGSGCYRFALKGLQPAG